jgi:protocatechuate 3,4-dioxygenase beta subunit
MGAHKLTRRQTIGIAGAAGAGYVLAGPRGLLDHLNDSDEALAKAAKKCVRLTPEQEEGPFYVNVNMIRRDIRESSQGVPLTLRVRVINPKTCRPIRHAAVDIWQANAAGVYSDEASEGTTGQSYLRGIQFTNKKGFATFQTIYPGHYQGRTTHIHVKVHIASEQSGGGISGGHVSHTGQLFFDDDVTTQVYAANSVYGGSTAARVLNSNDQVYTGQNGQRALLALKGGPSSGYTGSIVLGVNPNATPAAVGGGGGQGGPLSA